MRVKDIMNKAIVVDHDMDLKQAAKIMSDKNIGSLIVIKEKKIVGIITERDILNNLPCIDRKVSSVMSKNVKTINYKDNIKDAAIIMGENKIKRLPVVNDGELVGVVTATDIIANSETLNEDFFFE